MGARGPVPKRSDQRIRRNKDDAGPVEKVVSLEAVEVPELGLVDPHPLITDFYNGLIDSVQAQYYEPSDWAFARWTLHFADQLVKSKRPSSQMLVAINSALSDLLVSEGSRRRVRLEVERQQAGGELIDLAAMFRERMAQ